MSFSENLSNLQKKCAISNYRLAKEIGVHQTTVKNWKDGKQPILEHAHKVAEYFKTTVDELSR